jgi:hypothetical protein
MESSPREISAELAGLAYHPRFPDLSTGSVKGDSGASPSRIAIAALESRKFPTRNRWLSRPDVLKRRERGARQGARVRLLETEYQVKKAREALTDRISSEKQ